MKKAIQRHGILLVVILITIFYAVSIVNATREVSKQKNLVVQERTIRIGVENQLRDLSERNSKLKARIGELEAELINRETAFQERQAELNDTISNLKQQLDNLSDIRDGLEEEVDKMQRPQGGR